MRATEKASKYFEIRHKNSKEKRIDLKVSPKKNGGGGRCE